MIAWSPRGPRLGGEISGGYLLVRGSTGATFSTCDGPARGYATFEPGFGTALSEDGDSPARRVFPATGLSLGVSTSDADSSPYAYGAWLSTSIMLSGTAATDCDNCGTTTVFSIAVGYRWLGGIAEYYVTPKLGFLAAH